MGTLTPLRWIGVFLLLASCARDLKSDEDLTMTPKEFDQKILDVSIVPSKVTTPQSKVSKIENADNPKATQDKIDNQTNSNKKFEKISSSKVKETQMATKDEAPKAKTSLSKYWPFGVGEKMSMALRWGVVEGGVASLEVMPPKELNGVPVLHFHGEVKSSKMVNFFYKFENTIDSWIDLETLLPLRQEIKQLESGRWGRRVMLFDSKSNEVQFYEHMTKKEGEVKESRRIDKMEKGAQDLFGSLFFYRFVQHMPEGFQYSIHDKGKNFFADLRYVAHETIRVPAGTFKTVHYKVLPRLEGHLEPKGDVDIWISDDERRLLVEFNAKIKIGSVTGELIEYQEGEKINLPLPVWKTPVKAIPVKVGEGAEE